MDLFNRVHSSKAKNLSLVLPANQVSLSEAVTVWSSWKYFMYIQANTYVSFFPFLTQVGIYILYSAMHLAFFFTYQFSRTSLNIGWLLIVVKRMRSGTKVSWFNSHLSLTTFVTLDKLLCLPSLSLALKWG